MMNRPLFEGRNLRLTAINPETDAVIEASWTLDPDYAESLRDSYGRPMMVHEVKKLQERMNKESDEKRNQYHFAARLLNDTLIGFVRLRWISWSNGFGQLQLNIAEAEMMDRYGLEALEMMLRYSFSELNLYRISVSAPEYNSPLTELYHRAGFTEEVRQREFYFRHGQLWDRLIFGLLRDEWVEVELEAA